MLFLAIFGHFFESGVKSTFHLHLIFLLFDCTTFFCLICEGQLNPTFRRITVAVLKISPCQHFILNSMTFSVVAEVNNFKKSSRTDRSR